MCSSPNSCLGTSLSPAAAEMARLVQLPATLTLACNPNNTTQVRLAELSVTGSLRSTKKLAQHRGPAHKMTLLPDSPYIVLSAGEDGQVLKLLTLHKELLSKQGHSFLHETPNFFTYVGAVNGYQGTQARQDIAFEEWERQKGLYAIVNVTQKCRNAFTGANLQHPLLPHKFTLVLHLRKVGLLDFLSWVQSFHLSTRGSS